MSGGRSAVRSLVVAGSCLAWSALSTLSASAQTTEVTGFTASGASYRLLVPEGWTPSDGLVIWNHGFDYELLPTPPDPGPLVDLQLEQGWAVAASSYSLPGWALYRTARDLRELAQAFADRFGEPERVLVYGGSLGGLVSAQALEVSGIPNLHGAMIACGVVGGSRVWDAASDLRLIYDFVCDDVPGAALPGGLDGLPAGLESTPPVIQARINACTGIDLPRELRSSGQQERLDRILELAGIPERFFSVDMGYALYALTDLVRDPRKMDGEPALGNVGVVYPDPELDAGIERVAFDPQARERLLDNYTPTGKIGDAKVVAIHTDQDGLVFVEHLSDYASKVPARNLAIGVVVEEEPSHCDFTEAEAVAAWNALVSWSEGGAKPSAATLQADCRGLAENGEQAGPCRYDPAFRLEPFESRVLPRPQDAPPEPDSCVADEATHCLNAGRFEVRASWRAPDGESGPAFATPVTDDTGAFWFFRDGNLELFVKVLDGCASFDRFWVFATGLTDLEVELTVRDGASGELRRYGNAAGTPFVPVIDLDAFATCP